MGVASWWRAATWWSPGPLVLLAGGCQGRDLSRPDCRDREGNVPWPLPDTQPVLSTVPPGPSWAAWPSRTCGATGSAGRECRAARQEGGQGEYLQSPHPGTPDSPGTGTQPCGGISLPLIPLSSSPRLERGSPWGALVQPHASPSHPNSPHRGKALRDLTPPWGCPGLPVPGPELPGALGGSGSVRMCQVLA